MGYHKILNLPKYTFQKLIDFIRTVLDLQKILIKFSYSPPFLQTVSHVINISHCCGTFVKIDETILLLMHYWYSYIDMLLIYYWCVDCFQVLAIMDDYSLHCCMIYRKVERVETRVLITKRKFFFFSFYGMYMKL